MSQLSASEKAKAFLETASQFQLGALPTEAPHPRTTFLSELTQAHPDKAIDLLKDIEIQAQRSALLARLPELIALQNEIRDTLSSGGRIFLCGCGATGRLSLSLEVLWREVTEKQYSAQQDKVIGFIAGGDYALVRSIENFEDFPEYGARQLRDLNFSQNDLLIAVTEGGETPFVIGATEEALLISKRTPYFLYCNPREILAKTVERSRRILENPRIRSISLSTGPMALAGSTRLQASTALMMGVGACLFAYLEKEGSCERHIREFLKELEACSFLNLKPLIEREAELYSWGNLCIHRSDSYGITVLTDTAERSPTFSLIPFENDHETDPIPSWTYLVIPRAQSPQEAWQRILHRVPRPLTWENLVDRYGERILYGFNFCPLTIERRQKLAGEGRLHILDIERKDQAIHFQLENLSASLPRPQHLLNEHLILKTALNISSTVLMGRLGRFSGNLMLYVRSTNKKLIDRSIRFVSILLEEAGIDGYSYEDICYMLFETLESLQPGEPAVPATFEHIRALAHASGHVGTAPPLRKAR